MGGIYDSSLTRVQPVFRQLASADPSGQSWLPLVLERSSRWQHFIAGRSGWSPGGMLQPPCFEYKAASPEEYLRTVISLPNRLRWPLDRGVPKSYSKLTTDKRRLLLAGDHAVQKEAMQKLQQRCQGQCWWIFEGITRVDCALFPERLRLFVEGKRTELTLRDHTEWDPLRLQIFRNLDCLRQEAGDGEYALLAIVERGSAAHRDAELLDRDFTVAWASWPHLTEAQAQALWDRYLGYTTWEDLADAVGGMALPETAAEARALGLCY